MRTLRGAPLPPACRTGRADDQGLTLIELSIALVVLSVILVMTFTLLVGIQQQQQNQSATINGARNAQVAEQQLVQYLQAAATPIPSGAGLANPNVAPATSEQATSLVLPADLSNSPSGPTGPTGQGAPTTTGTLRASVVNCTNQCPARVDELKVSITGGTYPSTTGQTITTNAYYLLAPSTPLFTYEMNPTCSGCTAPVAMQMPPGGITNAACLQRIVAVKINASFLAGPINPRSLQGGAVVATTMQETVFVKNSCTAYNTTSCPNGDQLLPLPAGGC